MPKASPPGFQNQHNPEQNKALCSRKQKKRFPILDNPLITYVIVTYCLSDFYNVFFTYSIPHDLTYAESRNQAASVRASFFREVSRSACLKWVGYGFQQHS
jgi:hypothetical protein